MHPPHSRKKKKQKEHTKVVQITQNIRTLHKHMLYAVFKCFAVCLIYLRNHRAPHTAALITYQHCLMTRPLRRWSLSFLQQHAQSEQDEKAGGSRVMEGVSGRWGRSVVCTSELRNNWIQHWTQDWPDWQTHNEIIFNLINIVSLNAAKYSSNRSGLKFHKHNRRAHENILYIH